MHSDEWVGQGRDQQAGRGRRIIGKQGRGRGIISKQQCERGSAHAAAAGGEDQLPFSG